MDTDADLGLSVSGSPNVSHETGNGLLIEVESDYEKHWKDMPEFIQNKRKPFAQVLVRFTCQEDLDNFSNLIGQPLTPQTKSLWHPSVVRGTGRIRARYVDES